MNLLRAWREPEMIQITAQMRVLVAIEPVDGRKGIDSLAQLCQEKLAEDPFSGCVFVFSEPPAEPRSGCSAYDGRDTGWPKSVFRAERFVWWPEGSGAAKSLEAYEVQAADGGGRCVARARRRRCGGE